MIIHARLISVHSTGAMYWWKWDNLACDSCQRIQGSADWSHQLNLPSWSVLRIVMALTYPHPETVCETERGGGGQTEWLLFTRGLSHSVKGEGCSGWRWYQILARSVWWRCMPLAGCCWLCSCRWSCPEFWFWCTKLWIQDWKNLNQKLVCNI